MIRHRTGLSKFWSMAMGTEYTMSKVSASAGVLQFPCEEAADFASNTFEDLMRRARRFESCFTEPPDLRQAVEQQKRWGGTKDSP